MSLGGSPPDEVGDRQARQFDRACRLRRSLHCRRRGHASCRRCPRSGRDVAYAATAWSVFFIDSQIRRASITPPRAPRARGFLVGEGDPCFRAGAPGLVPVRVLFGSVLTIRLDLRGRRATTLAVALPAGSGRAGCLKLLVGRMRILRRLARGGCRPLSLAVRSQSSRSFPCRSAPPPQLEHHVPLCSSGAATTAARG